jgi:hypothetical protein
MQALGRHAAAFLAKCGIGFSGSVPGDDMKRTGDFKPAAEVVEKVQKTGGDDAHLTGAVVSQDVIDFPEGAGIVAAVPAIAGFQTFPGVGIEKRQTSIGGWGASAGGRLQRVRSKKGGNRCQPPPQKASAINA